MNTINRFQLVIDQGSSVNTPALTETLGKFPVAREVFSGNWIISAPGTAQEIQNALGPILGNAGYTVTYLDNSRLAQCVFHVDNAAGMLKDLQAA